MAHVGGDIAFYLQRAIVNSAPFHHLFRTIKVPTSLDEVTSIDDDAEVDPHEARLSRTAIERIWTRVKDLYATGYYPCLQLCLRRDGHIVVSRAIGHSVGNGPAGSAEAVKRLATPDTPVCVYSASKAITAVLIHKLAEQGAINLLDPVSSYVEEFGQAGKERITVYQLLSHRAGIPGVPEGTPIDLLYDHKRSLEMLCAQTPLDRYGRTQAYHALTGGIVLQAIIERVAGVGIREYWNRHFKEPMGFRYFDYGADADVRAVMAQDAMTGMRLPWPLNRYASRIIGADFDEAMTAINDERFYLQPIPSANMVATAEEVSRFYQMLLDNGSYRGKQLLDPMTVHRLTWEVSAHRLDNMVRVPIRFTPGLMLGGTPFGLFGRDSGDAFGHIGLVNTLTWADPKRSLSAALLTTGKPVLAHNLPALLRLLLTISREIGVEE